MKILHVVATLRSADGGGVKVVTGLTRSLARKGVDITIYAPSWSDIDTCTSIPEGVEVKFFKRGVLSRFWPGYSVPLKEALRKGCSEFDLIHAHNIWYYPQFAAYQAARLEKKPFIISVHGELFPYSLRHRAVKKKIFYALIQKKILKGASAIHAVSENEARIISRLTNHPDIFFIPNGINPKEFECSQKEDLIRRIYPQLKGKKIILFLGRIFPGKGLDVLTQAFAGLARKQNDAYLLIAGSDDWGYKNKLKEIINREGVSETVIFSGMLNEEKKKAALSVADLFVLPSYSEGFSMAILEAMACGIPVVISPQCNFPEVESMMAGRVIEAETGQLEKVISELLSQPKLCREMGDRGRALVSEHYNWDKIAHKMAAEYERIISSAK